MKTLTLLRHAKSGWDAPVARDFDRPLNARGRKAARAMGREMRGSASASISILASPAARVTETLTELAQGYGGAVATDFDERIYLASVETLARDRPRGRRRARAAADRRPQSGHGAARFAARRRRRAARPDRRQISDRRARRDRASTVPSWRDVAAGAGRLERFIRPRDLDPELGPED